jgi:hypothetical protein
MVEATDRSKNESSSRGKRAKKPKLHISQFPMLLSEHFKANVKKFEGLYQYQRIALPKVVCVDSGGPS